MSRILNSTDAAKHIAAQHGLKFAYNRSARKWILSAAPMDTEYEYAMYAPRDVADYSTDAFYRDCMRVAAYSVTPAQMDGVVTRYRAYALDELSQFRELTEEERAEYSRLMHDGARAGFDKQVLAVDNAIAMMIEEAEVLHGTYAEHRAAFAGMVATATYKTGHVYSNGREQQAVGYSVDGRFVMSLPARLNNGRIPDLDECADILAGLSVLESDPFCYPGRELHALARSIVEDTIAALPGALWGAALTVTGDGGPRRVAYVMWCGRRTHTLAVIATTPQRLMSHWAGFVDNCRIEQAASVAEVLARAPVDALPAMPGRVDLSKPPMPDHVASVLELPAEPAAFVLERVAAQLRARRLATVPAEHEEQPGNPCDGCNACLPAGESGTCEACTPVLLNHYLCPQCDNEWSDTWPCAVDDDCPECGARAITPYDSEEVDA